MLIPDRPGNRMAYGHLNVIENPQVGLLLVIPNTSETLRINGKAELSADPAVLESLAARGKPAVLAIRVSVEECFFHCGKAFIRSGLWKPDEWGERHRISFGQMYAAKEGGGKEMADTLDELIEQIRRDYGDAQLEVVLGDNKTLSVEAQQAVTELIGVIRTETAALQTSYELVEELVIDLKSLELQLLLPQPKTPIIREILRSIGTSLAKGDSSAAGQVKRFAG